MISVLRRSIRASSAIQLRNAGRETFTGGAGGKMGRVTESIFAFLSRNQRNATLYLGIAIEQVVELGAQIDL